MINLRHAEVSPRAVRSLAGALVGGLWRKGAAGKAAAVAVAPLVALDMVSSMILAAVLHMGITLARDVRNLFR